MPIRLHCDAPRCERSLEVALLAGSNRIYTRHASDWWIVATNSTHSPTIACCEMHLNLTIATVRPVVVCGADDEAAYA